MKSLSMRLGLLLVLTAVMIGCKGYEEGPDASIFTVKDRVTNTWRWQANILDGTYRTAQWADSTIQFSDEHVVSICDAAGEGCRTGAWDLVTKNSRLQLIFGATTEVYDIRYLSKTEMWLRSTNDTASVVEWELVPN
ncbi:hypothetical protein [Pontibacter sp. G13]|uniref:hypothetical protein n=1 Tax=Pontibacter sp. G13 TaxID=3074898 RepID=UPI0028894C0E|nr:hypothetical protein [Pontibacter sp. G13]WNJ16503.1 hypothetical protein RJD25_16680 [Pontibacter sp. G13]